MLLADYIDRLKEDAKLYKMSVLSHEINITATALYKWLSGENDLRLSHLIKLDEFINKHREL